MPCQAIVELAPASVLVCDGQHGFNALMMCALHDREDADLGDLAQAIISLAIAHQVPVYENAELVTWLGQLDIGEEIPEQLYQVIAEILAFVYRLEGRVPDQS